MAEEIPSPSEKPIVLPVSHLNRLWTLVTISLVLNTVVIVLIVIGAILHHHQMNDQFGGRHGFGGGRNEECRDRGFGRIGMSQGWGRPGDFRGGPGRPGPGMPGMMGGAKNGPPDPAKMSQNILDRLSQKLALTDDQKAKIKSIIDDQIATLQKQKEAMRDALKKQIEDAKAKMKPILTADQQKQLDAIPVPGQGPGQ
jgi:hypothetical protein